MLDESPISTNLGNDHGVYNHGILSPLVMRPFEEAQSKVMRAYAKSGQYHIIVEIRDS